MPTPKSNAPLERDRRQSEPVVRLERVECGVGKERELGQVDQAGGREVEVVEHLEEAPVAQEGPESHRAGENHDWVVPEHDRE